MVVGAIVEEEGEMEEEVFCRHGSITETISDDLKLLPLLVLCTDPEARATPNDDSRSQVLAAMEESYGRSHKSKQRLQAKTTSEADNQQTKAIWSD